MKSLRPRAFNSSMPAPSKPMKRSKLSSVGKPERRAKHDALYRQKLAKARRGKGYKGAMQRADGRCEGRVLVRARVYDDPNPAPYEWEERCTNAEELEAHHLTYARFGGKELPEDFRVLCPEHHAAAESLHVTRRKWWEK